MTDQTTDAVGEAGKRAAEAVSRERKVLAAYNWNHADETRHLASIIAAEFAPLAEEVDRLRKIETALPKTADGIPIVPGMRLFYPLAGNRRGEVQEQIVNESLNLTHRDAEITVTDYCWYSTKEAALATVAGSGEVKRG